MRLNGIFLNRPRVLLKVRRRDGLPIHPGPPGMPPLDDGEVGRRVLKPEESVTFQYSGSDYFGTDLSPASIKYSFATKTSFRRKEIETGKIETEWLGFRSDQAMDTTKIARVTSHKTVPWYETLMYGRSA